MSRSSACSTTLEITRRSPNSTSSLVFLQVKGQIQGVMKVMVVMKMMKIMKVMKVMKVVILSGV